jgi:N-acylglucosamine 2-epimerase
MLFSLAFWEAGAAVDDPRMGEHAIRLADDILEHFVSPQDRAIIEYLDWNNGRLPGAVGRCFLPGHAFESMWALTRIFRACGRHADIPQCLEVIRWSLEQGWDPQFGGVYLAIDLGGETPYWPFADYKPWWPAVEAMCALLLAYAESKAPWCLDWYQRVHNYAFTHYPVRPNGEWRNRLNRMGLPVEDVIALPVKDPFHLPRTLIYAEEVLNGLKDDPATVELVESC